MTFKSVSTSTNARWLKTVLTLSEIDTSIFQAHSFRSASSSAAFKAGCSLNNTLKTSNWSSAKNFKRFYLRDIQSTSCNDNSEFGQSVLNV
jgi:hypothetical protein